MPYRSPATLSLLLGHHLKAGKIGDSKSSRHCDVRSVTTTAHDNAADAGVVMTSVYCVPPTVEKHFGPAAEIHGIDIDRNPDVAEVAGAVARWNVHAPAERNGEMREVAAYTNAFVHGIGGAAGGACIRITESDFSMHEIANRLHPLRATGHLPELRPGEVGELVAIAIPALKKEQQHIVRKIGYRRHLCMRQRFIRLARVVNDEAI